MSLRIPLNWVLVKISGDFEKYHSQDTGADTGIHVAPWGANAASHIAVTGVVISAPEQLIFNGYDMAPLKADKMRNAEEQEYIAMLRRQSMAYDVPIEVEPGDTVYFEYTTRLDAVKEGRAIFDGEDRYLFIPYDLLIMKFRPGCDMENVNPGDIYLLNGFVLIKILEYATEKAENHIRGFKTENDLFLPESKRPDAKYVHRQNTWYATILTAGCKVKAYADFPLSGGDGTIPVNPGLKIIFDGRQKRRLEVEHHRVIFKNHVLHRIHRKDILGWFPNGKINGEVQLKIIK